MMRYMIYLLNINSAINVFPFFFIFSLYRMHCNFYQQLQLEIIIVSCLKILLYLQVFVKKLSFQIWISVVSVLEES